MMIPLRRALIGYGPNGPSTTIDYHRFIVHDLDGELILAGAFELDASTTPKSITWIDSMGPDEGKQLPASYTLEGEDFVFIAGDQGTPRPTVFSTGPGQTMRTMRRRS